MPTRAVNFRPRTGARCVSGAEGSGIQWLTPSASPCSATGHCMRGNHCPYSLEYSAMSAPQRAENTMMSSSAGAVAIGRQSRFDTGPLPVILMPAAREGGAGIRAAGCAS